MNEMQKDNFDMLISAAVVQCVHHDADDLSSVDTSDVPDTSRLYKKVMRNLPGSRRTAVKAIVTLVLAAALLALTACACLPEVRDYFWGVVTEWYGEYFEVSFEQEEQTSSNSMDSDIIVPTTIEQKAVLTKLPEGCYLGEETLLTGQYHVNYYTGNNEWKFTLSQYLFSSNDILIDSENSEIVRVYVDQNEGLLLEEKYGDTIYYYLLWQDNGYQYMIFGIFDSVTDVVLLAQSLALVELG